MKDISNQESLVLELFQENFLERLEEKKPGVKKELILREADVFEEEGSVLKSVVLATEDDKQVVTYFNIEEVDAKPKKMVLYADKSGPENEVYILTEDRVIPLDIDENKVTTSASFCLAGGYKHCGPDCGDNGSKGGGTPINSLDLCCRTHDRCYANFGMYDCECDKRVVACAMAQIALGNNVIAATTVVGWFSTGGQVICNN
ncbi:hypothetical protein HNO89_000394 [Sporosarcina luteola]|nr:hypothetical protein [Sporosarcina luteola]